MILIVLFDDNNYLFPIILAWLCPSFEWHVQLILSLDLGGKLRDICLGKAYIVMINDGISWCKWIIAS